MRFVAIALATGFLGTLFASNVQGFTAPAGTDTGFSSFAESDLDYAATGSIAGASRGSHPAAVRLIDLRSGATCRTDGAPPTNVTFADASLGADCRRSPSFARIAYWRSTGDGSLIMADSGGGTVLEFAPGDGVLYESVFPEDALITIVPARS